jgi:predicted nucleic acid-binding protein
MSSLVVADNSPIAYLCEIHQVELLHKLFGVIYVPAAVYNELCHPKTPVLARTWALKPPPWLKIDSTSEVDDPATRHLDAGERAAIALADRLHADLILMDERRGTNVCRAKGFEATGTLGILIRAANRGWVDLGDAFQCLKETNFRHSPEMLEQLLKNHHAGR